MAQPMTNQGYLLPTTKVLDTQIVYSSQINSDEFKEFIVRLANLANDLLFAVNSRDDGHYVPFEFVCGQQYYPNPDLNSATTQVPSFRPVFREVVRFIGALPDNSFVAKPHNITISSNITFTRIYGVANDTTGFNYIPIPYVATNGNIIQLNVNATDVTITTNFDATNYTITRVVIEYLKS